LSPAKRSKQQSLFRGAEPEDGGEPARKGKGRAKAKAETASDSGCSWKRASSQFLLT